MFPDYENKLHEINTWIWLVSVIAPMVMYGIKIGSRSYYIAAVVWVLSQFINLRIEPFLNEFVSSSDDNLIYWYATWATLDVLCIFVIFFVHWRHKISIGFTSLSIIVAYSLLALLQTIRHFELDLFGTHHLTQLYTVGINTGNIAITVIITMPLLIFIWKNKLSQRNQNV